MFIPLGDNLERPNFPTATVALICLNVLIFAFTYRNHLTEEHIQFGDREAEEHLEEVIEFYKTWGLVPKALAEDGQVIGLITSVFLHASIMHLVGNMIILWAFGQSLETALGGLPFVVLYMLWGVLAGLSQCVVDFSNEMPLIGASGAIAGVIGAYVMLLGYSANIKMLFLLGLIPFRFDIPAIYVGSGWFLLQLMNGSMDANGTLSGVAWMAHIGGFLVGVGTLLIYRNQTDRILTRTSSGGLTFQTREERDETVPETDEAGEPVITATADVMDQVEIQDIHCRGCQTELTADHKIGPGLLRCPSCSQLCYLQSEILMS